jgi:hypothetical protein
MLHACFTPISICFVYTSWHFCAFFGTNLLTRCYCASSYFLLFLYFRKVVHKYSQNWMKQSVKFLFFCHVHGVQRGDGEEPGGGHTIGWREHTSGRATTWCGPLGCPPTSPFRLYIASNTTTLNELASIHEKFRSAAAIEDEFRGTKISVPTPRRDRELPLEPSSSTLPPSSSPLLTPMMRRD